jgi:hypothetical protein
MKMNLTTEDAVSQTPSKKVCKGPKKRKEAGWRTVLAAELPDGLGDEGFMGLEEFDAPKMFSSANGALTSPQIISSLNSNSIVESDRGDNAGKADKGLQKVRSAKMAKLAHVPSDPVDSSKSVLPQTRPGVESRGPHESVITASAAEELKANVRHHQEKVRAQKALRDEVRVRTPLRSLVMYHRCYLIICTRQRRACRAWLTASSITKYD